MAVARSPLFRALRPVAATAVIAAIVGGGLLIAAPASAVPDAPTITSPAGSLDTVGPDVTVSGDLAVPSGYDYVRVLWRQGSTVVDECFQGLGPGETVFSCTIAVPPPGVYTVVAQHSDSPEPGLNDWSADSNAVTIRVGTADTVVITSQTGYGNEWSGRAVTLSGTGPALGSVDVEIVYNPGGGGGEQRDPFCTDPEVDASGQWTCTGMSPSWGYVYFAASGTTIEGQETVPGSYDDEIGGDMVPPAPTTDIVLGPASVTFSAQGAVDTFLVMRLYEAMLNGEGSSFTERGVCSADGAPPAISCTFSALTPGIWNFYTNQDYNEAYFRTLDEYVMIPEAPTAFAAIVRDDRSVRFSGRGEPGFRAIVIDGAQNTVCSAIVATNGAWSCTATPPAGTASYRSVQQSVGFDSNNFEVFSDRSLDGFSAVSAAVSVTVPPRPAPPAPAPAPTPLVWQLQGYDGSPLIPGEQLTLTASGLPNGTEIVVEIRSTPQVLGTTVADATGSFELAVAVPLDIEPGDHTLVATATPPGGVASVVSIPVIVEPAPVVEPASEPVGEGAPADDGSSDAGSSGVAAALADRSDPASPSAITDSIPTIQRVFTDPWVVAASGGLALAILLLVAFPAELLNSTLSSNTGRLGRWFLAIERRTEQVTEWFARVSRTRALAAAVLVAVTAFVFGFVDPQFGVDPVSLRMTVSLAIGLFVVTYVAAWITGALARRAWGVSTQVSLQPVALLFAIVGVVIARLLEFSPGFLIGLVIGLDLLSRVDEGVRARVVVLRTAVTAGLAVLAWVVFSILAAVSTGAPGWPELLVQDALVATTAEGLTAALAALLPLGFLEGHDLFRHSKRLWSATVVAVAALFALIVLPTAEGETTDVADVGFWMLIMVLFAVVTLTLWAVLQFTGGRGGHGEAAGPTSDAVPTSVGG